MNVQAEYTGTHKVILPPDYMNSVEAVCDLHGVDNVQLRMALEKQNIPVLTLEKEYGAKADIGRMKTRVQAFLEMIGGRR